MQRSRLTAPQWLGQLPPHYLGVAFTAAACIGTALRLIGESSHAPGFIDLGRILLGAAQLALYIVVTWYRDDDALAAGVLLALTLIIGGLGATVLVGIVLDRSLTAAIALVTFSPLALIFQAIFLIPLSAAIVWIARKVSIMVERALRAP